MIKYTLRALILLALLNLTACASHAPAPSYGCKRGDCLSAMANADWLEGRNNYTEEYPAVELFWIEDDEVRKEILLMKNGALL